MDEVRLDFSRYSVKGRGDSFWEVESKVIMNAPFIHGCASTDFSVFLNYVVGLKMSKNDLRFSDDTVLAYRFDGGFPEKEKMVVRSIMNLDLNSPCEDGLVEDVLSSIASMSSLFGVKSEEQRESLGLWFPDDYVILPSGLSQ